MIWFGEFKFSHDWPGLVKNSWRCCYELNLEFMSENAHPTQISYWIPLVSYWVNIWISFSELGLRFCMMFDYDIPRACHAEEFAKCPGMAIPGFEEWTIYVNYVMYNEYVWLYVIIWFGWCSSRSVEFEILFALIVNTDQNGLTLLTARLKNKMLYILTMVRMKRRVWCHWNQSKNHAQMDVADGQGKASFTKSIVVITVVIQLGSMIRLMDVETLTRLNGFTHIEQPFVLMGLTSMVAIDTTYFCTTLW